MGMCKMAHAEAVGNGADNEVIFIGQDGKEAVITGYVRSFYVRSNAGLNNQDASVRVKQPDGLGGIIDTQLGSSINLATATSSRGNQNIGRNVVGAKLAGHVVNGNNNTDVDFVVVWETDPV